MVANIVLITFVYLIQTTKKISYHQYHPVKLGTVHTEEKFEFLVTLEEQSNGLINL